MPRDASTARQRNGLGACLLHEPPGKVVSRNRRGRLARPDCADAADLQRVDHARGQRDRRHDDDQVRLAALAELEHRCRGRLVANLDRAGELGDGRVRLGAKAAHGGASWRALECAGDSQLPRPASDHSHRRHVEPGFLTHDRFQSDRDLPLMKGGTLWQEPFNIWLLFRCPLFVDIN